MGEATRNPNVAAAPAALAGGDVRLGGPKINSNDPREGGGAGAEIGAANRPKVDIRLPRMVVESDDIKLLLTLGEP